MRLLGKKLVSTKTNPAKLGHYCPACDCLHFVSIDKHIIPTFMFNGDLEKPSITPNVKIKYGEEERERQVCFYQLTCGMIKYFHACTHEYAGMVKILPDIPRHMIEYFEISPSEAAKRAQKRI